MCVRYSVYGICVLYRSVWSVCGVGVWCVRVVCVYCVYMYVCGARNQSSGITCAGHFPTDLHLQLLEWMCFNKSLRRLWDNVKCEDHWATGTVVWSRRCDQWRGRIEYKTSFVSDLSNLYKVMLFTATERNKMGREMGFWWDLSWCFRSVKLASSKISLYLLGL